jgi:uncharacterized membrane protein
MHRNRASVASETPVRHGRASVASGRTRVLYAATAGLAAGAAVAAFSPWQFIVLIGWATTALVVAGGVWARISRFDPEETAQWATREDNTRAGAELLLLGAAVASLIGVAFAMVKAKQGDQFWDLLLTSASVLTVVSSWLLVHTIFTLRYASLYYTNPVGGIDFKAKAEEPDYLDFAYTAFTVGMTFQVSDTDITQRVMRRAVLRHALLAFLFGAVILATTVNVVASLLN